MKRKQTIPTISCIAAVLSLLLLTGCYNTPLSTCPIQDTDQAQDTNQTQDTSPENQMHNTSENHHEPQNNIRHISSKKAREIAVDFVGYGEVHDINAFTDEGTLIFEVDVRHGTMRYVVLLNAENGNVTSLNRHEDGSPQPTPSPSTSGQGSRPSSPAISLDRAIEIANADLASRGINATYRSNSGMDLERGQWVWELLFSTQGERMPLIEYYINVDNGNIVKFEWDD